MSEHKYERIIASVRAADEWETTVAIVIMREDGVVGDVWVAAGVPDYQRGSATAAASNRGYEDVWPVGDSLDCWCPAEFRGDAEAVLEFVHDIALETHRDYQRDPATCIVERAE